MQNKKIPRDRVGGGRDGSETNSQPRVREKSRRYAYGGMLPPDVEIARLRSELRLATAALLTSQEMERKRMACELHDSVGQSLNTISFSLGVAIERLQRGENQDVVDSLDSIRAHVRGLLDEVRRIALDLRPAMLDDLGIIGTLSWFFRNFASIYPRLKLMTTVDVEERDIPAVLITPLYRVVQEAMSNVVKHAEASQIEVDLRCDKRGVVLSIGDDGRGFVVPVQDGGAANGHGVGLMGMRNRVEFAGGEFLLDSQPGAGTKIVAIWPIEGIQRGCIDA